MIDFVVFTIVMSILEPYPRRLSESIQRTYFIRGHWGLRIGDNSNHLSTLSAVTGVSELVITVIIYRQSQGLASW